MERLSELSNSVALAMLAVCVGLILYDCRRDIRQLVSARNVFILTIMAWFLLEASLVPKALTLFTAEQYNFGLVCVGVCIAAFIIGYSSSRGGVFDPVFRRLARIDSPRVLWGVFIIACLIGFAPLLYLAKGNPLLILEDAFTFKARWSGLFTRGRYGGVKDAFLELRMFLRAAIPLAAAILVHRKQPTDRKLIVGFFLVYMFMDALTGGTRSKVVEVFLPIAAAIYWRMSPAMKKNSITFGLPAIVVFAMFWSAANVLGRNEGKLDWERASSADYVGFEMFRELLYITNLVPEKSDYKLGYTYYVQAINPIPRAIWKNKPTGDAGLELAKVKGMLAGGDAYLTVSPGLIGEMYWNFGIPGIALISFFLGYLAKSWDRARPLTTQSVLAFTVFAAGLAIIFLSGRSFNMSTLYGMLSLYALLVLFSGNVRRQPVSTKQPRQTRQPEYPVRSLLP